MPPRPASMASQRAGQKRKVVEVSRPTRKEERSGFEDLELDGGLDDGDSQNTGSNDEEEEEYDEDDDDNEEGLDDSEDDVPEWDSDDSDSNGSLAELDLRKHVQDLETKLEADRSARRKMMGSDTARDVSSIHPDTPLAPLPLVFDETDAAPPNYELSTDANGNPRYIYKEIEPAYDSDDSDAAVTANTIGNIPLSYYDAYPHIGYDINGRRISRPAKGEALDSLLESIDLPEGWTGLTDPSTGQPLKLTPEELDVLKKLTRHEAPGDGYDPYPDMVEWFTGKGKEEVMPLSAAPEPKRRFVPSAHEHKRVMKMVKAIKDGRIKPYREPTQEEKDREEAEQEFASYDVWANEEPRPDHPMNVPAPKLPPPGYEESYHPPPEYLPDKHEREEWEKQDDEDRVRDFLPKDYSALRKVPGYANLVKEKFERCLDLYLAPRVRRSKLNIDPESLLPKLPDPQELKPFPTTTATIYRGHEGRVRTLAIDPSGTWVVSGGEDGTVRLWDILTGRQLWRVRLSSSEAVNVVSWRPDQNTCIIAACCGETVFFMIPPSNLVVPDVEEESQQILDAGFGYAAAAPTKNAAGVDQVSSASWSRTPTALQAKGVYLSLTLRSSPKTLTWHRRGDYFSTVSPSNSSAASTAVAIHTLSKHQTQFPFKRLRGLAQTACFHSSRPLFFVATRQSVRIYDLQAQKLEKELRPGARWISGISLHPLGSNLLVSSYDKRLLWHDLDLGNTPYKTLRYHSKAIRNVHFHPTLPLFADASDDGTLQIFHGKVVGDSMENATIVPLKVLRGHKIQKELGVFDVQWHPREAWCISAGADGTMRLWT